MRRVLYLLSLACLVPLLAAAQDMPTLPAISQPATNEHTPGKFTWFDLATPAPGTSQGFYQDLFGWTYSSPGRNADDYMIILNQGRAIGGMFRAEPPSGAQDGATWLALMSVEDVDKAVAIARAAGGKTEVPATNVPGRGRHALLRDPADAIFGVVRSSSGDPDDAEVPIGGIFWVDLFARDVSGMADFYAQLAPYEIAERQIAEGSVGRLLIASDLPRAGIVPADEEANRAAWVPYVRVNNVQGVLDQAVESGGFVIVAPDPALLDGNLGIFVDPNGGVMGVVKWDYDAEDQP